MKINCKFGLGQNSRFQMFHQVSSEGMGALFFSIGIKDQWGLYWAP